MNIDTESKLRLTLGYVGLMAMVALGGCGGPESGTVVGKKYEPESHYTTMVCYSYRKDTSCALSLPQDNTDPPAWKIKVRNGDDSGWVDVDQDTYKVTRVGTCYPDPEVDACE